MPPPPGSSLEITSSTLAREARLWVNIMASSVVFLCHPECVNEWVSVFLSLSCVFSKVGSFPFDGLFCPILMC